MNLEKVITADGTATLKRVDLNETYHSTHGAVQESLHVFIKNGLSICPQSSLRILEVGLGTGLNVLLTALHAGKNQKIIYESLEALPISAEWAGQTGYGNLATGSSDWLNRIHTAAHGEFITLHEGMQFRVLHTRLQDYIPENVFDLIYYDAFGPRSQPEMWNEEAVACLTRAASKGTILVTYCSQGQFRRNLVAAGWKVEKLPGPPGKREMVRAVFRPEEL